MLHANSNRTFQFDKSVIEANAPDEPGIIIYYNKDENIEGFKIADQSIKVTLVELLDQDKFSYFWFKVVDNLDL